MNKLIIPLLILASVIVISGCEGLCTQNGEECCTGDTCSVASITCTTQEFNPVFKGCSLDCHPIWTCEPISNQGSCIEVEPFTCCRGDDCNTIDVDCSEGYHAVSRGCDENCYADGTCVPMENIDCISSCNAIPERGSAITDYELEQGWYYGRLEDKKQGTPENWIHGQEGYRSAAWSKPTGSLEACDCNLYFDPEPIRTIDNCDSACVAAGFPSGGCTGVPVVPNPCSTVGKATLPYNPSIGVQCDPPDVPEGWVGAGTACCCDVTKEDTKYCETDDDCQVVGGIGCGCGCFNQNFIIDENLACACSEPTACECIQNICLESLDS